MNRIARIQVNETLSRRERVQRSMGLWIMHAWVRLRQKTHAMAQEEEGQGTTEYAVLVGVLVVIAIAAVVLFRDRIQSLWNDIANSINSL